MIDERSRVIPSLDFDVLENEDDLKNLIAEGELSYYENELAILENNPLGLSVGKLNDFQTTFLFNYIDNEVVNEFNNRKTKGDIVNSFIMAMPNYKEITESIWTIEEKAIEWDNEGNPINWEDKVVMHNRLSYQKWKVNATKYWTNHSLQGYVRDFKSLLEGQLDRVETLQEAIYNDALDENNSESFRLQNRRLAVDISGLKNVRVVQETDFFHTGGGSLVKKTLDNMAQPDYDFGYNEIEVVDMEVDKDG